MMHDEKKLYNLYRSHSRRNYYKLKDLGPDFKIIPIDDLSFKVSLQLTDKVSITTDEYHTDIKTGRNKCAKKANSYLKSLPEVKDNFIKFSTIKYYIVLFLIIVFFIYCLFLKNEYPIFGFCLIILYSILVSPFFFQHMEIGTVVGMDVMVRRNSTIENHFSRNVLRVTNGDMVLISKVAFPTKPNKKLFEAIIIKDLPLEVFKNSSKTFKKYILQVNSCVRVNYEQGDDGKIKYAVRIVSYEKDGKEKKFVNNDVNIEHFSTNDDFEKYHVFSKHGFHLVKQRYIELSGLNGFEWYSQVLSIYIDYIISLISYLHNKLYIQLFNLDNDNSSDTIFNDGY